MKKCFFAYSNTPFKVNEPISDAVRIINKSGTIHIDTWEALNIDGNIIIDEILERIMQSDIFICELSSFNLNVLFELGYAIAKKKKIKIFLNLSLADVENKFNNLNILSSIAYTNYINSNNLQTEIWKIIEDDTEDILSKTIANKSRFSNCHELFYMKNLYDTDESIILSRTIEELKIKLIVDDPNEVSIQPLEWYFQILLNCNGVITHLLSDQYVNAKIYNQKASFIAGIAYGLDIPLLMVVGAPFTVPMDYRNIIKIYNRKNDCIEFVNNWFEKYKDSIKADNKSTQYTQQELKAFSDLHSIDLGESLAENEQEKILNYFVKTSSYNDALNRNLSIFIGRKGTGKTANLVNLAEEFKNKKTTFVL